MKKLHAVLIVSAIVLAGVATGLCVGCAIESDGKFKGSVENPFPWANESRPASQPTTGG